MKGIMKDLFDITYRKKHSIPETEEIDSEEVKKEALEEIDETLEEIEKYWQEVKNMTLEEVLQKALDYFV